MRETPQKLYIVLQDAVHFMIGLSLLSMPELGRKFTKFIDFADVRIESFSPKTRFRFFLCKYFFQIVLSHTCKIQHDWLRCEEDIVKLPKGARALSFLGSY